MTRPDDDAEGVARAFEAQRRQVEQMVLAAAGLKSARDAFVAAGFTTAEAIELCKAVLTASITGPTDR